MNIYEKYLVSEAKNNLPRSLENTYYQITKPFDVYILTGHKKSNAYYGSANILQAQWKKVKAKKGDEIHNLAGGLFFVPRGKGTGHDMHVTEPDFDPFTRGGHYDKFDLKKLVQIDVTSAMNARYQR